MASYAIKYTLGEGSYYRGMTAIGPRFGADEEEATRFATVKDAGDVLHSFPIMAELCSKVVEVCDAKDYYVTVCAACSRANCWHDEFRCEQSNTAGATVALASELRTAGRENESNYSISKLLQVEGKICYADGSVRHDR